MINSSFPKLASINKIKDLKTLKHFLTYQKHKTEKYVNLKILVLILI